MSDTFWMVWNPAARAPAVKHASEQSATSEAERLARQHPEQEFYVLQAIERRQLTRMVRERLTPPDDDCPF